MSREVTCGACGGTGKVIEYERWERAQRIIDQLVGWAELRDLEFVSLDVEGSYPAAVVLGTIYHGESAIEAVERELKYWGMRGDDVPTHPLNSTGGTYEPVDPRFYQ